MHVFTVAFSCRAGQNFKPQIAELASALAPHVVKSDWLRMGAKVEGESAEAAEAHPARSIGRRPLQIAGESRLHSEVLEGRPSRDPRVLRMEEQPGISGCVGVHTPAAVDQGFPDGLPGSQQAKATEVDFFAFSKADLCARVELSCSAGCCRGDRW